MVNRYWILTADRVLKSFGYQTETFSLLHPSKPISISSTKLRDGCLVLYEDGYVDSFGTAPLLGDLTAFQLEAPPRDIEISPTGTGYWVIDQKGSVFSFGGAPFLEGVPQVSEGQIDASRIRATSNGDGYWIISRTGEIFCFGTALFHGAMQQSEEPRGLEIIQFFAKSDLSEYTLLTSDGTLVRFNDPSMQPVKSKVLIDDIVGAVKMSNGLILVSKRGAVISHGGAPNLGSTVLSNSPVLAVS